MRFVAAVIASVIAAATLSNALALDGKVCRSVQRTGPSVVQVCGEKLHAFALRISDFKRSSAEGAHGWFAFECPIEPMCEGEPVIGGFFISPDDWLNGARDERAIEQLLLSGLVSLHRASSAFTVACPSFDVTIGGMAGRLACFEEASTKLRFVALVAADDQTGFLLLFHQQGQAASNLREKALEMIPRFKVERASGDVELLKWFQPGQLEFLKISK